MAGVGGPFQSVNGPSERAGLMNLVGRERVNPAGGTLIRPTIVPSKVVNSTMKP